MEMSSLGNKKQIPVMLKEVLAEFDDYLININNNFDNPAIILDLTLGDAGHSYNLLRIAKSKLKDFRLVSLDWDIASINYVLRNFSTEISRFIKCDINCDNIHISSLHTNNKWDVIQSNFLWVDKLFEKINYSKAFFVIADLGVSSRQLLAKNRGFSYKNPSILDMRMAKEYQEVIASDILNAFSKKELRNLFVRTIGLSKDLASYIANKIIKARLEKPFGDKDDVKRLSIISYDLKYKNLGKFGYFKYNPTTLLLLALRIAVNSELENLFNIWSKLKNIVLQNARVIFLGFHSAEWEILETVPQLYNFELKKVLAVSSKEKAQNKRARSAKMFVFEYHE